MPVLAPVVSLAVRGLVVASGGQVRKVVNVFSYQNTGGPGPPFDLNGLATQFHLTAWTLIAPFLHTDYAGDAYIAYLDPLLNPPGTLTTQAPPNGGTAGGREPISACVNFWCQTGLRGKSFRSVKRFGPVPTSLVTKDELTPAAQAALQVQVNKLLLPLATADGNTFGAVLLSRQLSTEGPPAVFVGAPLTAVVVNRTLGLARHRRERTQR
jgi:hypothetical protein